MVIQSKNGWCAPAHAQQLRKARSVTTSGTDARPHPRSHRYIIDFASKERRAGPQQRHGCPSVGWSPKSKGRPIDHEPRIRHQTMLQFEYSNMLTTVKQHPITRSHNPRLSLASCDRQRCLPKFFGKIYELFALNEPTGPSTHFCTTKQCKTLYTSHCGWGGSVGSMGWGGVQFFLGLAAKVGFAHGTRG